MLVEHALGELRQVAIDNNLKEPWDIIMEPWMRDAHLNVQLSETVCVCAASAASTSFTAPMARPATDSSGGQPFDQQSQHQHGSGPSREQRVEEQSETPKELKDLMAGNISDKPWQKQKCSAGNALWQGAALRRRMHHRRTNVSLGVCTTDVSGPHEPTPRPGGHIAKDPCYCFWS